MKIAIIGGGPCGLGAAWRLNELGLDDWDIFERCNQWGGLSTSFQDSDGFCWDIGGHVLFSHYAYFDEVMDTLLGKEDGWVFHEREAWAWMQDRFIPYPMQNNIHRLPRDVFWECLEGIIEIQNKGNRTDRPENFGEWIDACFGSGLAKWFLRPYNFKVWGYPVEDMGWSWVGDRVSRVELKKVLENYVYNKDSISWGPNATFRFPLYGGTGSIWKELAIRLPEDKVHLNHNVTGIATRDKEIVFDDGKKEPYDIIISSMPLNELVKISDLKPPHDISPPVKHSSVHIVGLALKGNPPEHLLTKCWMYFPENNCPFYRVTVFSNYSPNNVPDSKCQWSLMCEVSETNVKKVDHSTVVDDVIQGALNTKLVPNRAGIHHTWYHFVEKGYPTPSLDRDPVTSPFIHYFETLDIFSRGRFGAWKYEVGNMDHSFMQGVECVNRIVESNEEVTLMNPDIVNKGKFSRTC